MIKLFNFGRVFVLKQRGMKITKTYVDLRGLRLQMIEEALAKSDTRAISELFALTEDQFELWYRSVEAYQAKYGEN